MADNQNTYKNRLFKFDLLPKRTDEEIKVLQDRDNSIIYSFVLVFSGALAFFGLTLIQTLILEPRLSNRNQALNNLENQVNGFNNVRIAHGELIQKSNLLRDPLERDIGLDEFIRVSNEISANESIITAYGRENTGEFLLSFRVDNISDTVEIVNRAKNLIEVEDVLLRSVSSNISEDNYDFIMEFNIIRVSDTANEPS